MPQPVSFDGFVREPGTVARFPLGAANHAEFSVAAARHVVASFFEFHSGFTIEATLPAGLFGDLDEFLRGWVFGTFAGGVPFVVAQAADFRLASLTYAKFPSVIGPAALIFVDVIWFDEGTATAGGAVDAVFGSVFQVFAIPILFEFVAEKSLDLGKGYHVCGAALGRHVLWISNGQLEDAAKTVVAHAVVAFELDGFGYRNVVCKACYAFDPVTS